MTEFTADSLTLSILSVLVVFIKAQRIPNSLWLKFEQ